ncbi:MAG: dihydrodipicolinate synthase family protein [Bacteroidales bacterium]|nr:dihydrodipicolinate synthase family protein [Bacteroidales bacterium]
MNTIKKFEGLVAAPFTPMDKKGNLNTGMVAEYYDFLEKNKIAGAFINGSTGEGASLTQKEKLLHAVKWAECYKENGKVRVINLVGGTSYQECIENAIFSYEAGISAIALVAPYYFKPADDTCLAEFVTRVGESVPEMPVYFYHIPVLTGVNMNMFSFLKKISEMLPNFAGIKFTHEDFMDFFTCLNYKNGKYDMLWGRDECMLSALVLGTKGAVGSTYNYAAPLYNKLIKAFNDGDLTEARKLQQLSIDMITLLGKYGGMATGKSFMRYVGMDCGKFRSPVKNMTEKMYEDFVKDIQLLNMEKYFSKKL